MLATLLAAWIAVLLAEPAALHACAMHAGAGSEVHGASHAAHAPDAAPGGHATCTCLGHCSSTTPLVLGALAPDLASLLPTLPHPGRPAHEYLAAWVDFVLPFATAPPVALTA